MAPTDKDFLKSLGLPSLTVFPTATHFDFTQAGRRVLIIGPMGSGKSEWASRIWRDGEVASRKGDAVASLTTSGEVDRRHLFYVRSQIDRSRFKDYPDNALPYRGGYVECGENIAFIKDSFDLEEVLAQNRSAGTIIIDEASFFDERLAYVVQNHSLERGVQFIFPTLILNFRREIFNSTARLILDTATDVIPLTAYCEHHNCLNDAFYTYRYYLVDNQECPALYFDPLIIVGGDEERVGAVDPNYAARCDEHHYLPGKEYTFLHLKPLGERAAGGDEEPLRGELRALKENISKSFLYRHMEERYKEAIYMNALKSDYLAEKALIYLFSEQNVIGEELLVRLTYQLELDHTYMKRILNDNLRRVSFDQRPLVMEV